MCRYIYGYGCISPSLYICIYIYVYTIYTWILIVRRASWNNFHQLWMFTGIHLGGSHLGVVMFWGSLRKQKLPFLFWTVAMVVPGHPEVSWSILGHFPKYTPKNVARQLPLILGGNFWKTRFFPLIFLEGFDSIPLQRSWNSLPIWGGSNNANVW